MVIRPIGFRPYKPPFILIISYLAIIHSISLFRMNLNMLSIHSI